MIVSFELCINQVVDALRYEGYVKFGNNKLDYELSFALPIPRLLKHKPKSEDEVCRLCQIVISKDHSSIELTLGEYKTFFIIVGFVVDFYNSSQTRDPNEVIDLVVQKMMDDLGVSVRTSTTISRLYKLNSKEIEMLSGPKFGCVLV